jgi:type IV pilus biogenesis protein PilP
MSANAPGVPPIRPGTPGNNMMPNGAQPPLNPMAAMQPDQSGAGTVIPREAPLPPDSYLQDEQKSEKAYLSKLNDLEELKIDREIEETNQAIAAAKLATVTAQKSTSDLLTNKVPASTENAYSAPTQFNPNRGTTVVTEGLKLPFEVVTPEVPYQVISVSMELNRWSAVIGVQGKLFTVSVGDMLPEDGSVVASINKNGVTLRKGTKIRRISIISSV